MQRIVKEFYGVDIKMTTLSEKLLFDANDIASALRFSDPRPELIRAGLNSRSQHTLVKWLDNKEYHFVDLVFVVELVLRAEQETAKRFLIWLVKIGAAEVAKTVSFKSAELKTKETYDPSGSEVYAVTQIAKRFNLTAIDLNEILHKQGIQFKVNGQWVLYEKYQHKGYTKAAKVGWRKSNKDPLYTTYWTERGVRFIENVLLELGHGVQQELDMEEGYNNGN